MQSDSPGTLWSRAHFIALFGAVIAAGVPTTSVPPLWLSQLLTKRFKREDKLKRLHNMVPWARFSTRWLLQIHVDAQGHHNLPSPSKGYMYISNHQSYADILVLMGVLDTVAFLSKSLIKYLPVLGRCAYCGGTVFLERGKRDSREKALEETLDMCKRSTAVVVFPEGTRSATGDLRPKYHPRAIAGAFEEGLKVVPIGIYGTHRVIPKAMDRVNLGQRVAVRIGAPLDPLDHGSVDRFVASAWGEVEELFRQAKAAVES